MTVTTYAIPFISNNEISKTLYWNLFDDLSGGYFCTLDEIAPLADLLYLDDSKRVMEYLSFHGLLYEGVKVEHDQSKRDYIKALGKPIETKIKKPKIVW